MYLLNPFCCLKKMNTFELFSMSVFCGGKKTLILNVRLRRFFSFHIIVMHFTRFKIYELSKTFHSTAVSRTPRMVFHRKVHYDSRARRTVGNHNTLRPIFIWKTLRRVRKMLYSINVPSHTGSYSRSVVGRRTIARGYFISSSVIFMYSWSL